MKKRLYFTLNGVRYSVLLKTTETNSNYNVFGHVFRSGENMPLTGCTFKETDSDSYIKQVAIKSVQGLGNGNKELIKAFSAEEILDLLPTLSELEEIAFRKFGDDPEGAIKFNLIKKMAFIEGCDFIMSKIKAG